MLTYNKLKNLIYKPKVSILIPVYNGADFLEEAINSALNQDYKNIEIIVINDGSTDGGKTKKIIEKYEKSIIAVNLEINGGVGRALNKGIEVARGIYISWLSADDTYERNKIRKQINFIDKKTICFTDYKIINYLSEEIGEVNIEKFLRNVTYINKNPYGALYSGLVNGISLLIPRKILQQHPFNEKLKTTQDYDCWFRIFRMAKIKYLNLPLVNYRIHQNQGSHSNVFIKEGDEFWIKIYKDNFLSQELEKNNNRFIFLKFLIQSPYVNAKELIAEELQSKVFSQSEILRNQIYMSANSLGPVLYYSNDKTHKIISIKSVVTLLMIQYYLKKDFKFYFELNDLKQILNLYARSKIFKILIMFNLIIGLRLRVNSWLRRKFLEFFENDHSQSFFTPHIENKNVTDKAKITQIILKFEFEGFFANNKDKTKRVNADLDEILSFILKDLRKQTSNVILFQNEK
jgi:glycosyltransferase involved in cell wall biosynthesis